MMRLLKNLMGKMKEIIIFFNFLPIVQVSVGMYSNFLQSMSKKGLINIIVITR